MGLIESRTGYVDAEKTLTEPKAVVQIDADASSYVAIWFENKFNILFKIDEYLITI